MAKAHIVGKGWCKRIRYQGHDIFLSGYKTEAAVEKAARAPLMAIDKNAVSKGRGPDHGTLAQALQDYALDHLPFLKGAPQEGLPLDWCLSDAELFIWAALVSVPIR